VIRSNPDVPVGFRYTITVTDVISEDAKISGLTEGRSERVGLELSSPPGKEINSEEFRGVRCFTFSYR
jgi:hypothetical protein